MILFKKVYKHIFIPHDEMPGMLQCVYCDKIVRKDSVNIIKMRESQARCPRSSYKASYSEKRKGRYDCSNRRKK